MEEEVFEVLVARGADVDAVHELHAVFGVVEEVVEEVLVPDWGLRGGEASDSDGEDVHVQEGDLRPCVEGGGQAEFYFIFFRRVCLDWENFFFSVGEGGGEVRSYIVVEKRLLPSYHQPFPMPMCSPFLDRGISASFSCNCGIV